MLANQRKSYINELRAKIASFNSLLEKSPSISHFPQPTEAEFQAYYFHQIDLISKIGLIVGFLIFLLSFPLDILFSTVWKPALILRFCITTPLILILLFFVFTRYYIRFQQLLIFLILVIIAFSLTALAAIQSGLVTFYNYYNISIIVVLIFGLTVGGLRFWASLSLAVMSFSVMNIVFYFAIKRDALFFLHFAANNYLFLASAVLLLIHNYSKEILMRRQFLLRRVNKLKNALLYYMSRHDQLTNLYNRYEFKERLQQEWYRALRKQYPISLLIIDTDYFKQYNDAYGHLAGDHLLIRLARLLTDHARRASDLVARFGGDEFVIILPDTSAKEAHTLAERIRQSLVDLKIENVSPAIDNIITVTIGISTLIPTATTNSDLLLKIADEALLEGKEKGRNGVYFASSTESG